MKLISCHIENFGKFHEYSRDFCDGANIVCEENGWGKSTFAAFIRAMFYGFEGDRKRSLKENERKRYKPWQGGAFGGRLVFETGGKRYQISRIFKDKEANDEFELRDVRTNLPSKEYSKKIGEEIFKINRESFMRTIFIGQSECETQATDDINAKIGNLADNSNDLNNFEAANARLTEIVNQLNPNRVSGSIAKRGEEIAKYERIVQGGEGISDSIDRYQINLCAKEELLESLKARMQKAGEEQTLVSRQQSAAAKKSEWERLRRNVAGKKKEEEACRRAFPGDVPRPEEVKEKIAECGEMERTYERVLLHQLSEEEKSELSGLAGTFAEGAPSNEELDEKMAKAARLRDISREFDLEQMSPAETKRLARLEPYFGKDMKSVAAIVGKWNERNTRKVALSSNEVAFEALQAVVETRRSREFQQLRQSKKASSLWIAGTILAVIGGLGAIAAMATQAAGICLAAGIIIAAVGIVLVAAGIVGQRRGEPDQGGGARPERASASLELERLKRTMDRDRAFVAATDEEVAAYLEAHGKVFEESAVSAALQEITEEAVEYSALKKKREKAGKSTRAAQMKELERSVTVFLGRYGASLPERESVVGSDASSGSGPGRGNTSSPERESVVGSDVSSLSEPGRGNKPSPGRDFTDELYVLKNKAGRYAALREKQECFEKEVESFKKIGQGIVAFLNQHGYEPAESIASQLNDIREFVERYRNAAGALREAEEELGRFEAEHDMTVLEKIQVDESLPTLDELNQAIQRLADDIEKTHGMINDYNHTLEDLQKEYDEWESCRMELEELKKRQTAEREKYEHVLRARTKLGQAKEAMTAKYADPILRGFGTYYEMLSGESASRFHVDANTEITLDEYGKQRDTVVLSSGYQDLVGICLRIALVDAMYKEEAPFLVMDDPFANLDDGKISAGMEFIKTLAQKYQVIYFTCSNARGG